MSYTTADRVRRFMDIDADEATRNYLIDDKVEEVQTIIDTLTKTTFEGTSDTHYFHTYNDVDEDGILILDDWLYSLTTLLNGDSEDITGDVFLLPANKTPRYGIGLKSETWTTDDDGYPEDAIAVTGVWGWSETAPYDIRQAATELAAFLVQSSRNPAQESVSFQEGGVIVLPKAFPPRVWHICESYRKKLV